MTFTAMARMGRIVRQVVTVGVLALVFGVLAASPAAANQRGDAVTAANDFIYGCIYNGGDIAGAASKEEHIVVVCLHEGGRTQQCQWDAAHGWERTCWWDVRSPDGDGPGVDIGDTIYQGDAAGRQGATVQADSEAPTSIVAASGDSNDGDQHHKGKKGKKGGKGRK